MQDKDLLKQNELKSSGSTEEFMKFVKNHEKLIREAGYPKYFAFPVQSSFPHQQLVIDKGFVSYDYCQRRHELGTKSTHKVAKRELTERVQRVQGAIFNCLNIIGK